MSELKPASIESITKLWVYPWHIRIWTKEKEIPGMHSREVYTRLESEVTAWLVVSSQRITKRNELALFILGLADVMAVEITTEYGSGIFLHRE